MKLSEILKDIDVEQEINFTGSEEVKGISINSKDIGECYIFAAIKGTRTDGHRYITKSVNSGASVIIHSNDLKSYEDNITYIKVKNTQDIISTLASNYYKNPGKYLTIVGITGTNGKTTITYLLESILKQVEDSISIFGTINYRLGDNVYDASTTTPDPVRLQKYFDESIKNNIRYIVMEVSSHSIAQQRILFSDFNYGIFTNLTQDHLDYHNSIQDYFLTKKKFFEKLPQTSIAAINNDDKYGKIIKESVDCSVVTYGIDSESDIYAEDIKLDIDKSEFTIVDNRCRHQVKTNLIGKYNIYNILAAFSISREMNIPPEKIITGIEKLKNVPGRVEKILTDKGITIIIDYAHTPDALYNVLTNIKKISKGKVIVVFGCGGDRDKTKRPLMGKIAVECADHVIITSDNPRTEKPSEIIKDILSGIEKNLHIFFQTEINRTRAIKKSIKFAQDRDIIIIAGKGHEDYQIIGNRRRKFSDRKEIEKILAKEKIKILN